jgi:hypothetical protein
MTFSRLFNFAAPVYGPMAMNNQKPIIICDLYPDFTREEQEQAETNLRRYLASLLRMAERLESEGRSINDLVDCQFDDSGDQR